jgi:asparagine synthase (glutamine-hydrolysing)
MCGIWAYFVRYGPNLTPEDFELHSPWAHAASARGPDRYSEIRGLRHHMVFHRLAIHDLSIRGDQPFFASNRRGVMCHLMCNGEIYNYKELIQKYNLTMQSSSDCEVILRLLMLFQFNVDKVLQEIQGEFAFIARIQYPSGHERILAARDPFGVRPLYYAHTQKGFLFSSTLRGIDGFCGHSEKVKGHHLPPGTYLSLEDNETILHAYYDIRTKVPNTFQYDLKFHQKRVTDTLIRAVERRLDSDRPIGFLLSGGLDSSLIVGIVRHILQYPASKLHTFSIGTPESPDVKYARLVANHCDTNHTFVPFHPSAAFKEIDHVIRDIETYDITTIRASTPQYILAKHISEETSIRVILNGDGADETEAGYLYFHAAPSCDEMHQECIRLLRNIHMYDGLRVDRTLGSNGLEARIPYLDPEFVEAYLAVPPEWRMPSYQNLEKSFLRDAFAHLYPNVLPKEVLYRTKDAFSDGVSQHKSGSSWYEIIQDFTKEFVSEKLETIVRRKYADSLSPPTKEAIYYSDIFHSYYPCHGHILTEYWMPKWLPATDPSARTLSVYKTD